MLWNLLAARTYLTREYAKKCAYTLLYHGGTDPWLDHIVLEEFNLILKEMPPCPSCRPTQPLVPTTFSPTSL
jgi:hypothetical protein